MEQEEREQLLSASVNSTESTNAPVVYQVYKYRWFVLVICGLLNASNAMIWISYAPVANHAKIFYNATFSDINWFSLVYPIANIPAGFLSSWLMDSIGLRFGLILASILNGSGSLVRVLGAYSSVSGNHMFLVTMIGQLLCGCSQPFILSAPTKVAALWFSEQQRATANMLGSMCNPLGVLLGNLVSPFLVQKPQDVPLLMVVTAVPAAALALLSVVGIRSSVPPTPPSASAEQESANFVAGLKQIIRNFPYVVLMLCFGVGLGLFTAMSTLIEQILCPHGYGDYFAGVCGGLFIALGVLGAAVISPVLDKTKKFKEIAKIGYCCAAVFGAIFAVVSRYRNAEGWIAISIGLFGLFGFAVYPVSLELSVECTYPVAEATCAGFLIISGQVFSVVFITLMQALARPLAAKDLRWQKCQSLYHGGVVSDYTIPALFGAGMAALVAVVMVTCFWPRYRRLEAEQRHAAENILKFNNPADIPIYT